MNRSGSPLVITMRRPSLKTMLLYLWFFNLITLTLARYLLTSFGLSSGLIRESALWLVASIPLIVCLFHMRQIEAKRLLTFFRLFGIIVVAYCLTALLNPDVVPFLTRENYGPERIFRPDAPMFALLFFLMFDDPEELKKDVTAYAYIYFAYEMLFSVLPAQQRGYWINTSSLGKELRLPYSLSFGYAMCFPTVVFLYNTIKEKKPIHIVLTLACLWCIVTNGNRGAIVIPLIFCALMLISGILENKDVSKKLLKITMILVGCVLFYLFSGYLLRWGVSILNRLGISSRTVDMLEDGSFSEDNGRVTIWLASLSAIKEEGLFGYGIYGDRPFVAPIHYVGYSHNLFLELLVSFGVIGIGICIHIVLDSIRMIFFCKDRRWRELYIIFFSISCQLLLSLSFWYVWTFWAAAAIAYNYRHFQKKEAAKGFHRAMFPGRLVGRTGMERRK